MKALHVDLLSRRHQFSSIPAYAAEVRMLFTICNILKFPLLCKNTSLVLLITVSVCKTSCDEVRHNMSQRGSVSSHSLVRIPIIRLHYLYLTFTSVFVPLHQGVVHIFSLLSYY